MSALTFSAVTQRLQILRRHVDDALAPRHDRVGASNRDRAARELHLRGQHQVFAFVCVGQDTAGHHAGRVAEIEQRVPLGFGRTGRRALESSLANLGEKSPGIYRRGAKVAELSYVGSLRSSRLCGRILAPHFLRGPVL